MSVKGIPTEPPKKALAQTGILADTGEPFLAFMVDGQMIIGVKGSELLALFQMLKDLLEGKQTRAAFYG